MSNKNPFEIRSDILALAKDYMDQVTKVNTDMATKLYQSSLISIDEFKAAMKPYTMEELMAKASEMYGFVTKKD